MRPPGPRPPRGRLPDPGWLGTLGLHDHALLLLAGLVPVAALAIWALARRRQRAGAAPTTARRIALAEVGLVVLTLPALWVTLLPFTGDGRTAATVSLVPLRDLTTMSTLQVVGNLALLAGIGSLAPVRWAALASLPRVLALAATCSASIETAQYLLPLGRVASVDDVLLNSVGAGLASLASRPWWRAGPRRAAG